MLTEDQMFQAILAGDGTHDGHFFFGVITTGIFCFPSCPSRKPRRENVRFFRSRAEAERARLRPCKRCRPDLDDGKSSLDANLLERVDQHIHSHLESVTVEGLAKHLSISASHLYKVLHQLTGLPPHQYILRWRLEVAKQFLAESALPVLEIAFVTGFKSANTFYEAFRRMLGCTPSEYRRRTSPLPKSPSAPELAGRTT